LLTSHELELCDVHELCEVVEGSRPGLSALLRNLNSGLPALSDALSATYLSHATISRHLSQELA
jgi:hypothetical protein